MRLTYSNIENLNLFLAKKCEEYMKDRNWKGRGRSNNKGRNRRKKRYYNRVSKREIKSKPVEFLKRIGLHFYP
ncbi:MAG: hypothetical protein ACRD8Z_14480 [Nitrososphaeraceae archaeon]